MEKAARSDHRNDLRVGPALGLLIKRKREAADLTINKLSPQVGISHSYLYRLERGEYDNPSLGVLVRIARRLDIQPEDLSVVIGITRTDELPSFGSYIRIKHPGWPERVISMITEFHDLLEHKYSR